MLQRHMRHGLIRALVVLALLIADLAWPTTARADEARAAEHFAAASQLFDRGEFRGAARTFVQAYEEEPHPAPLYNAGLAWIGAARLDHAADMFALALGMEGLSPEQEADATAKLEDAQRSLVVVELVGVGRLARVQLDEGPTLPREAKLHAAMGTHVVRVRDGDSTEEREVVVSSLAPRVVEVRFGEPEPASLSARLVGGIALFGASLVFGGVAIGAGVTGQAAADDVLADIDAGTIDAETYDLRDQASELKVVANVCWVFAATTLVAGAALTIWEVTDTATVSASPTGATFRLRF